MPTSVKATSSSTYSASYGPTYAIDGYYDYSNANFFHSGHETYPWLDAEMAATSVAKVTLKSRCDAPGWSHSPFTIVVR